MDNSIEQSHQHYFQQPTTVNCYQSEYLSLFNDDTVNGTPTIYLLDELTHTIDLLDKPMFVVNNVLSSTLVSQSFCTAVCTNLKKMASCKCKTYIYKRGQR